MFEYLASVSRRDEIGKDRTSQPEVVCVPAAARAAEGLLAGLPSVSSVLEYGDHCQIHKTLAALLGQAFFDTGDDVQGSTNVAGAWMRRSGHLDLATATFTGFDVDKVN